jgi:hypothetical protein
MRSNKQAYLRAIERRRREDDAARLKAKVPTLSSLVIEVKESGEEVGDLDVSYIRRVVVDRAPAMFELPCSDRRCDGGGHELTRRFLKALRDGQATFEGTHRCAGNIKEEDCPLELHFVANATYA